MACGAGVDGELRARGLARQERLQNGVLAFGLGRALVRRFVLPKPGEGPNAAEREAGRYEIVFSGTDAAGQRHQLHARGRRDPGYGATSRVIVACARTLLQQGDEAQAGITTPGAALGLAALPALQQLAELRFEPVAA
jgi:short subunit dehydrogenase-like uncharacterized protein